MSTCHVTGLKLGMDIKGEQKAIMVLVLMILTICRRESSQIIMEINVKVKIIINTRKQG